MEPNTQTESGRENAAEGRPQAVPENSHVQESSSETPSMPIGRESGTRNLKIIFVAAVVVIAAILGYLFFGMDGRQVFNSERDGGEHVAMVNGIGISQKEYEQSITSITGTAAQQGADVADPEIQSLIKEEALTGLINNELLLQEAKGTGIEIAEEDIDREYGLIEQNFGGSAALNSRMEELGFTEAEVREDIAEQLAISKYVTSQINLESLRPTDEEISKYYDSLSADGVDLPPLEAIGPQIAAQLETQKQQEAVHSLIDTLRQKAEIEILI